MGTSSNTAKGAHGTVTEERFVVSLVVLRPCAFCGLAFNICIPQRRFWGGGKRLEKGRGAISSDLGGGGMGR